MEIPIESAGQVDCIDGRADRDVALGTQTWCIAEEYEGQRVDAVLAQYLPETSLRTRRRLCESGAVWLTVRPVGAAVKVRAGQTLSVTMPVATAMRISPQDLQGETLCQDSQDISEHSIQALQAKATGNMPLEIVYQDADFAVLYKAVGLHTVALAGSSTPSLEHSIRQATGPFAEQAESLTLLTRLDKETCGFVVVAFSADAIERWRLAESRGRVEKIYMALVEGNWTEAYTVCRALDTAKRRVTRVRNDDTSDQRRHTYVDPVESFAAGACPHLPEYPHETTLVRCRILQGARHQIRAHLAAAGHPLVYDVVYGGSAQLSDSTVADGKGLESTTFILQNVEIKSPFFVVRRDF